MGDGKDAELSSPTSGTRSRAPTESCLSGRSTPRIRTDAQGTLIERGKKAHKVFFVDEVRDGASIQEVREVKSYKNGSIGCRCTLM